MIFMNYKIIYSDELYHHGIKGMKWGVRNNKQSTYRRYGKGNTPLDALKRDARNKKAFTQKKRAELKAAKGPLNKGKVAASWYLNMPVTVLGFTGTKEMTFRERLIRGDGLF